MKNPIRLLLVVSLLAGAFGIAQAQSPDYLKVNVPFDFIAGSRHLPAGEYQLRRVQERDPSMLRLVNAKGDSTVLTIMHTESLADANTRFVFQNGGEDYVLTALRTSHEIYNLRNARADQLRKVAATEYSISGSN